MILWSAEWEIAGNNTGLGSKETWILIFQWDFEVNKVWIQLFTSLRVVFILLVPSSGSHFKAICINFHQQLGWNHQDCSRWLVLLVSEAKYIFIKVEEMIMANSNLAVLQEQIKVSHSHSSDVDFWQVGMNFKSWDFKEVLEILYLCDM